MELGIREFVVSDTATDCRSAQPQFFYGMFQLLNREIRELKRHRGKGDETVRLLPAKIREAFVVDLDDLLGAVAIGRVPERVDAKRFDIDALLVHGTQAFFGHEDDALLVMLGRVLPED